MTTLYTNVGCPVKVTGLPTIPPLVDELIHITFPTDVVVQMRVVEVKDTHIYVRSDYDNDEETTRFRLYFKQEDCPDWTPGHETPGEALRR